MVIRGAAVYTEDSRFENKDIFIDGDIFTDRDCSGEVVDGSGCIAIPGFTDIHFHGCVGKDFCDGSIEAIDAIAAYQARVGVTTIAPATMTMDENTLYAVCDAAAEYRSRQEAGEFAEGAILCGINMEGPFISKEKMGAQNPEYIQRANDELYQNMQEKSGGLIKLVAVAPETEGAMQFIRDKRDETVLSVAHTTADYDTAMEAFDAGATHVTHLYNAMQPFSHRAPGVIGAAADAGAEAELICDGVHVHPSAVRAAFKMFGEDNIIFISDSMMATGLADGDYSLGGQPVKVVGNLATLKDGTIAGSATNLMQCFRIAVQQMKIPFETAVKCAAVNPAKSIGIYEKYGSISAGKVANLILLDKDSLEVKQVILRGKMLLADEEI